MPPVLQVVPTDFAHYYSNGSGRDSYICMRNGGLTAMPIHRNQVHLRGNVHAPPLQILLPSYATGNSLAAEAIAAADRNNPKARAQRKHQKQVSEYLHAARSSTNTGGKTARAQATAAAAAATAGTTFAAGSSGDYAIPAAPMTYRGFEYTDRSLTSDEFLNMNGSMSARLPPTRNPYQSQLQQSQRPSFGRSWDSATMSNNMRVSNGRKLRPLTGLAAASATTTMTPAMRIMQNEQEEPTSKQSSATDLPMPLPMTMTMAQQTNQPGPMQQSLFDSFAATTAAAAAAQPQRIAAFQPAPPQTARGATVTSPSRTFNSSGEQKFIPVSQPSYHITLPKNSSYCDHAQTHRSVQDNNSFASAGFSITAKLKSKGIDESVIPLLA